MKDGEVVRMTGRKEGVRMTEEGGREVVRMTERKEGER